MSPKTMEVLQMLKYGFRQDRLDFSEGLVASEKELSDLEVSQSVVDTLLSEGRLDELVSLLNDHNADL